MLNDKIENIIINLPYGLSDDEKMVYLYHELGKILSKDEKFFYDTDYDYNEHKFSNPDEIDNFKVVCKSCAYLFSQVGIQIGLRLEPVELTKAIDGNFSHYGIRYHGENDKVYLLNPVYDFYRMQMGFETKHFGITSNYKDYDAETFDRFDDERLKKIEKKLGYVDSMYSEDLFEKLKVSMMRKLGHHIIKTSSFYQDYLLLMIDLIKNDDLSIDEKLKQVCLFDKDCEKYKDVIIECFDKKMITRKMRNNIRSYAYKNLTEKKTDLDIIRDGSSYSGYLDVSSFDKKSNVDKDDIMLYKFNYFIKSLSQLTENITGFIENKLYLDKVFSYVFNDEERKNIRRHTLYTKEDNNKKYYMIYDIRLSNNEDSVYVFYDPYTKESRRAGDLVNFLIENKMHVLESSSLNNKIDDLVDDDDVNEISVKNVSIK